MLKQLVDIILNSEHEVKDGTLFCKGLIVDSKVFRCIEFLEFNAALENTNYKNELEESVDLEITLARLNAVGFYESFEVFVTKYKYEEPPIPYYILDLRTFNNGDSDVIANYLIVLDFVKSIRMISKYCFSDIDLDNAIIFSEEKTLILPFKYDSNLCRLPNSNTYTSMTEVAGVFSDSVSEKRLLFQNELISFLSPINEEFRFEYLVTHIETYYNDSLSSYQYYLRDFSYNKLKVELDSKALDFAQKIQGVINDSQTKLIAIPTAFVLALSSFDFANIDSVKNIVLFFSLIIFSVLIQLFLNNQQSTLKFIKQNIDAYKGTFRETIIENTTDRFFLVEIEFKRQEKRLQLVEVIVWAIPFGLFSFSLYFIYEIATIVVVYIGLVILHGFLRFKWENNSIKY